MGAADGLRGARLTCVCGRQCTVSWTVHELLDTCAYPPYRETTGDWTCRTSTAFMVGDGPPPTASPRPTLIFKPGRRAAPARHTHSGPHAAAGH